MKTKLLLLTFALFFHFSQTNAQQTYIPDDAFEQALIDQGYDIVLDDYVQTSNISGITQLGIMNRGISDLTGIEDFIALEELDCEHNNLSSLNLNQNTALKKLDCGDNQLTSLNITQCILLEELEASKNQLTSLDLIQNVALTKLLCDRNNLAVLNVTQNTNLKILVCGENQLTTLDVSQNVLLENLQCSINQINSLDVNQCVSLATLMAYSNALTNLDLTQNINLGVVWIHNNQLTNLDVRNGNNTAISGFWTTDNPNLTCIFVDDASYSTNNSGWEKDPAAFYVENQAQCDAIAGVEERFLQKVKIYPNPVRNKLHISLPLFYFGKLLFRITDITGKTLVVTEQKNREFGIDISHLSQGIYFLNIYKDKTKLLTQKLIKL